MKKKKKHDGRACIGMGVLRRYVTHTHGRIRKSCFRTMRRSIALSDMSTNSSPASSDGMGDMMDFQIPMVLV